MKPHLSILRSLPVVLFLLLLTMPAGARIDDAEFEDIVEEEIQKSGSLQELNKKIDHKASEVRDLEERLYVYEENIKKKQDEELTLKSQIALLEEKIEETTVEIEKKTIELEVLQLEIEALQEQIRLAEDEIAYQRSLLAELIRQLYAFDEQTPLEITFSNSTFSDLFSDIEYISRVQTNLQDTLDRVQRTKEQLEDRRTEVKEKKAEIAAQKADLEVEQQTLEGEGKYKNQLLEETQESEEKFQLLYEKVREEQSQIEGSIAGLEKVAQEKIDAIREKVLERLQDDDAANDQLTDEEQFLIGEEVTFAWPVDSQTITCEFHCGDYPFRRLFEHAGIDIAVSMGTDVRAAASGYVTRVVSDGSNRLAWVMIVHGDGLASVYMHLSDVNVTVDEYVSQGDIIGSSGGMPGTPGAGAYSTGPHLHFEIRVDGIATDPLNYLP